MLPKLRCPRNGKQLFSNYSRSHVLTASHATCTSCASLINCNLSSEYANPLTAHADREGAVRIAASPDTGHGHGSRCHGGWSVRSCSFLPDQTRLWLVLSALLARSG